MLTLQNIYIQYSDRILLQSVSLVIKPGERIGLVGRNGAGKSTLLKIIAGEMNPQEGEVIRPSMFTLGYLHQDMFLPKGKTVIDETLTAFSEVLELERRLKQLEHEMNTRTDYESEEYTELIIQLSDVSERLHFLGGDTMEADAEKILSGLGFKQSDLLRQTTEFSGGWQMRIELAKMLLRKPDILLLDEPTNHLDIESILWLEDFLNNYSGMAVVISHDKRFLDNITNRTVEVMLGKLYDYKAPYSAYVELSRERREQMINAFENQQRIIADKERTIARFMAKATKTKMAQSMQKQLDKLERIEINDEDNSVMNLRFPPAPRSGEVVAEAISVGKQYGNLNVIEKADFTILRGDRVAFVGQNGQGKTTLAKILIGVETATKGNINLGHNVNVGYYAQNQAESLDPKITLLETMELHSPPELRTRLRAMLGAFLFSGEDVGKKVSVLSGGERARLALACMLLRPVNFLVLDEPTNHLDMVSKDMLKQAIQDYDGTLLVVSHDRDFLSGLSTRTIEFRDHHLNEHLGDINYFLERRKLDDMREVEKRQATNWGTNKTQTEAKSNSTPKVEIGLTPDEIKNYQKVVQKTEKRIAELEAAIKNMEIEMGHSDFYSRPDSQKSLQAYNSAKSELEAAYTTWEEAAAKI